MRKGNSIYSQVRGKTLAMALLSALAVCAVALITIGYIYRDVVTSTKALGKQAAEDSMNALIVQAETELVVLAGNKAAVADEMLNSVSAAVNAIANSATEIMSHPQDYGQRGVPPPDPANAGVVTPQLLFAENADPASLTSEIALIGNMMELLLTIQHNSNMISGTQIAAESGFTIITGTDSDKKPRYYNPRHSLWYQAAKEKNGLIWMDIPDGANLRGSAITCAMPYYRPGGEVAGVVCADMLLAHLNDLNRESRIGETGRAFVVNERGEVIIYDAMEKDAGGIKRANLLESESPAVREQAKNMTARKFGIERVTIGGEDVFIAYYPLEALPWSFGMIMSVDEVTAPATESSRHIADITDGALLALKHKIYLSIWLLAALLILIIILVSAVSHGLAKNITAPIIALSNSAGIIGGGELGHRMSIHTNDELESLAGAFNTMIDNIERITRDRQRIDTELAVATKIQTSMLPCVFPPFPEREEFDIYAAMFPAKEVGGDFYDFFLIGGDIVSIVIADVSGKGVPAALLMVRAKTLIKNNAQFGMRPAEVFAKVNDILCENNDTGMFVTAFMAYYEIPTGRLTCVNAGHNPPMIRRGNGSFELFPVKPGFVLAGLNSTRYEEEEILLTCGSEIFLYTDGLTEAVNAQGEFFSTARLLEAANRHKSKAIQSFGDSIKFELDCFEEGAEQADDVTMLVMTVRNCPDSAGEVG